MSLQERVCSPDLGFRGFGAQSCHAGVQPEGATHVGEQSSEGVRHVAPAPVEEAGEGAVAVALLTSWPKVVGELGKVMQPLVCLQWIGCFSTFKQHPQGTSIQSSTAATGSTAAAVL